MLLSGARAAKFSIAQRRKTVLSRRCEGPSLEKGDFFCRIPLRSESMFQLINGTIECGECRNEILHGEEFDCEYCSASLCENCIAQHENECITWLLVKSPQFH
jgi:hypothetical protein